jgi:hypothetical protein
VCYSGVVSTFPYSGRSVARQQLLATSLRLDNRAPLGAGHFFSPDLLLAKTGFGGLNNMILLSTGANSDHKNLTPQKTPKQNGLL